MNYGNLQRSPIVNLEPIKNVTGVWRLLPGATSAWPKPTAQRAWSRQAISWMPFKRSGKFLVHANDDRNWKPNSATRKLRCATKWA